MILLPLLMTIVEDEAAQREEEADVGDQERCVDDGACSSGVAGQVFGMEGTSEEKMGLDQGFIGG